MGYTVGQVMTLEMQVDKCKVFSEGHYFSSLEYLCLDDRVPEPNKLAPQFKECMKIGGYAGIEYYDNNLVKGITCYADIELLLDQEEQDNLQDDLFHIMKLAFSIPDSEVSNVYKDCHYVIEVVTDKDAYDGVSSGYMSTTYEDYGNKECTSLMKDEIRYADDKLDDKKAELWGSLKDEHFELNQSMRILVGSAFFYPNEIVSGEFNGCWYNLVVTTNSTESDNISLTYDHINDPDCSFATTSNIKKAWNSITLNEFDQKWEKVYEVKDY